MYNLDMQMYDGEQQGPFAKPFGCGEPETIISQLS